MIDPTMDMAQGSGMTPMHRKRRLWLGLASMLLIAGILVWLIADYGGTWKDRFVPRKFRVVEPEAIFASGQIDRHLIRGVLTDYHIRVIVCLIGGDDTNPDSTAEDQAARELGITRVYFPLSGDGTGDIHEYADAIAAIVAAQKAGEPVLVHCSSGSQRTNGAVFFYRVLVEKRDPDATAEEMFRNGHDPRENPALIPYLNQHMAEMARLLVERGVIDQVPDPLPQIHHE
jgi:protein tyrosine phosphatase (PTP) superfamily phosphohydrolase (DUF442 family)